MTLRISDNQLTYESCGHNVYDVTLFDDEIRTLVTHEPSYVREWISEIKYIHRRRLHQLLVGLDVEWRPNTSRNVVNPVATLQLCVGRRCLVFQIIHAPRIPQSLANFLGNSNYTFVGVGIGRDVEKLWEDYGLEVVNAVDLRGLAAEHYGRREIWNEGLKNMALQILGKEVEKPKRITMSKWDNPSLTPAQLESQDIPYLLPKSTLPPPTDVVTGINAWNDFLIL